MRRRKNGLARTHTVERLKRAQADLAAARGAAATAREEAAQLRGQVEALQAQHAQLMQLLKKRGS
jgi:colicin import membrane protein